MSSSSGFRGLGCSDSGAEAAQVVDGQFAQIGDDFFGHSKLFGGVGIGYGDRVHAGVVGGFDAPMRILDDDALAGRDGLRGILVQFTERQQETFGVGFSFIDLFGGDYNVEVRAEVGVGEDEFDLGSERAGAYRHWDIVLLEHFKALADTIYDFAFCFR